MTGTALRPFLAAAGFACLLLGGLGLVLPVLPTTPFMIAAAACFSRSSPRFEQWLVNHPFLGRHIAAWRRNRVIPVRAKQLALTMMALSFAAVLLTPLASPLVTIATGAILAGCALYVVTRPSA